MIKEFKEFISRGNVLDLAVGVIIGGAFTTIVNSFVAGLITPLIGLVISLVVPGAKNMDDATKGMVFKINQVEFDYGSVISAVITFLITAIVLFMIIKAVNKANDTMSKNKEEEQPEEVSVETSEDILKDIRQLLSAEQSKQLDEIDIKNK